MNNLIGHYSRAANYRGPDENGLVTGLVWGPWMPLWDKTKARTRRLHGLRYDGCMSWKKATMVAREVRKYHKELGKGFGLS